MTNRNQPPTHGDLVRARGYGDRVFQVESFYDQTWHYPDETWTDRIYELFDVGNADYIEADQSDLTLIADAGQADDYLDANPAPIEPTSDWMTFGMSYLDINGGGDETMKAKEPRKPTARELSGQEAERRKQARKERAARIDELLDARNDTEELAVFFGDKDGEYGAKVAEIDRELAELSGEDLR